MFFLYRTVFSQETLDILCKRLVCRQTIIVGKKDKSSRNTSRGPPQRNQLKPRSQQCPKQETFLFTSQGHTRYTQNIILIRSLRTRQWHTIEIYKNQVDRRLVNTEVDRGPVKSSGSRTLI